MTRLLGNWISSYVEFTDGLPSPMRLRLWVALGTISAALQRKVSTRIRGQDQFANMFIMLVGPPGIGKGVAMRPALQMLRDLGSDEVHIAPQGITRRAFYSTLEASAKTERHLDGGIDLHCSLTAFIEEFGVFVKGGDLDFMYHLADVFDNPEIFHYKTEHAGEHFIENASFVMLAACTPRGLKDILTDTALEMGFPARIVMVYSDEQVNVPIFGEREDLPELREALVTDLHSIHNIRGQFIWEQEAKDAIMQWAEKGLVPLPKDQRFEHYNTRRLTQVTKIAQLVSAACSDDLVVTGKDMKAAKDLLLDAESVMHHSIKSLGANPLLTQQQFVVKLVGTYFENTGKGMPEDMIIRNVASEIHPQYLRTFIDVIAEGNWLDFRKVNEKRVFYPRGMAREKAGDSHTK